MADPQAAQLTQLRNIQSKTGKSIAELHAGITASGLAKTGERRSMLMERFKLGYGDANVVALLYGKAPPSLDAGTPQPPEVSVDDALETIYSGTKAHLRPLHDMVIEQVKKLGEFEQAPKKSYVSLRRARQFLMVGPATKDQIEIGLNHKNLASHPRLKLLPPGGMCQATTRIASAADLDAQLKAWIKQAYDSAG